MLGVRDHNMRSNCGLQGRIAPVVKVESLVDYRSCVGSISYQKKSLPKLDDGSEEEIMNLSQGGRPMARRITTFYSPRN